MGKVNTKARMWFLSQEQWDTAHRPQLSEGWEQENVSENSNTTNSSDQDSDSPQMETGAPATLTSSYTGFNSPFRKSSLGAEVCS